MRLTRGDPAPPPPAGLAAEQSAILRATDAHCTQGDEGIRATPSLTLLLWEENVPAGGVGKHLASGPSLGPLCSELRCQFSLFLENQMEHFTCPHPQVLVLGGDDYAPPPPSVFGGLSL